MPLAWTGLVLSQQQEMMAVLIQRGVSALHRPAMSSKIGLDADHRADPGAFARAEEGDHAVHGAMVGERQGGLPQSLGALDQLFNAAKAVKKRKLGVDVEVDEVFGHGR